MSKELQWHFVREQHLLKWQMRSKRCLFLKTLLSLFKLGNELFFFQIEKGTCILKEEGGFYCQCEDGSTGEENCRSHPCSTNICGEHGICQRQGFNYVCKCIQGFVFLLFLIQLNCSFWFTFRFETDMRAEIVRREAELAYPIHVWTEFASITMVHSNATATRAISARRAKSVSSTRTSFHCLICWRAHHNFELEFWRELKSKRVLVPLEPLHQQRNLHWQRRRLCLLLSAWLCRQQLRILIQSRNEHLLFQIALQIWRMQARWWRVSFFLSHVQLSFNSPRPFFY